MNLVKRLIIGIIVSGSLLAATLSWLVRQNSFDVASSAGSDDAGEPMQAYFYKEIGTTVKNQSVEQESPPDAQYTAEIEATTEIQKAQQTVTTLSRKGVDAFYTPLNRNGNVIFRIRSGVFTSEREAKRHAATLREKYAVDSKIVKF